MTLSGNLYYRLLKEEIKTFPLNKKIDYDEKRVLIVCKRTGRLLVCKRDSDKWALWKNFRDETGFTGDVKIINDATLRYDHGRYEIVITLGVVEKEFVPRLMGDVTNFNWVMFDEIGKLPMEGLLKKYLRSISGSIEKFYKKFITEDLI